MANLPNLELRVAVPSGAAVVRDYVAGEAAAVDLYGGHFESLDRYRSKAAEVDRRFDRVARERAAQAMEAVPGTDPERLGRFVSERGYVVTTGQQPGLFGGPLYSIYKALTAVRLAERLEAELERPVLPLFWIASEDHDWAEVDHTWLVGVDNELHRLEVAAPEPDVHHPLHRIRLGPDIEQRVAELAAHLPGTDLSASWVDAVREAYPRGATLPGAFASLLRRCLEGSGLYVTDAAHAVVKAASATTLAQELERGEELERILTRRVAELENAGYGVQVPILPGGSNLFLEGPAGRERLYRQDGSFRLHTSGLALSAEDVRARLAQEPDTVSPNVLLRPVVESVVFPTLAYVGGPGELAYFAQLSGYFEALGVEMPVVHPRFGATPVESKIRKVLDKFGLDVPALERPFHELAAEIARDEVPDGVRKALGELRGGVARGTAELQKQTDAVDPTLRGPVQHVRSHAFDAIDDLEKKLLQAIKRENEIALAQLEKARLHLFPLGKPSERVQSPLYYLARYGDGFVQALLERFEVNLR